MFGEGSTQDWCTVVLVLDGVEARRKKNFTGEWTFYDLLPGLYTVLAYDSQSELAVEEIVSLPRLSSTSGSPLSPFTTSGIYIYTLSCSHLCANVCSNI